MLVAPSKPAEPEWKAVMGAQVLFAPIDRLMLRRARRAAEAVLKVPDDAGGVVAVVADDAAVEEQFALLGDALSHALLMAGVLDWRDVFVMADDDDTGAGEPLACTDEAKRRLFADPLVFEEFDAAYVVPFATRERERAAPGKDLPRSQSGIGTKVKAESDTVPSPVTASAAAAKNVRTSPTRRKPRPKKTSGAS